MKICNKCKTEKSEEEFSKNSARADGLQSNCKECCKVNNREYYSLNNEKQRKQIREAKKKRRENLQSKIIEYLLTHPCVKCNEKDILVLDFDHIENKISNISDLIKECCPWSVLEEEIKKCQVLCANCHRRKTHAQFSSYKWQYKKLILDQVCHNEN